MVVTRTWKRGDRLDIEFPMDVMEIVAHPEVKYNRNRIALQRGPLVYCVEGADNNGQAFNFIVPENTAYQAQFIPGLLGGVVAIQFNAPTLQRQSDTRVETVTKSITAIPYFLWCNRGQNEMQVWLPRKFETLRVNPDN